MMDHWQPYPNNRKILKKENYYVIVPADHDFNSKETMPLFCEVCGLRFSSKSDEESYKKFYCCSPCADTWAYAHKEEWKKGWRPSKDQIEKVVQRRSFVNKHIRFE